MKICKFCGTENQDLVAHCTSCNGNEFSHKCNNCGAMFTGTYCQNCGVKFDDYGKRCPQCGKVFFSTACPDCGWRSGNWAVEQMPVTNNQKAPMFIQVSADEHHWYENARLESEPEFMPPPPVVPDKKPKNIPLRALLWICFFPIMLCILIGKSSLSHKSKFYLVLVVIVATILIYSHLPGGDDVSENVTEATTSEQTASMSTTMTTEVETSLTQESAEAIRIVDGELGEYGAVVTLDDYDYIWYYIPEGKYLVTSETDMPLVKVYLDKNEPITNAEGYQESVVVTELDLTDGAQEHIVEVTSDTHIFVTINAVVNFQSIA